MPPITCPIFAVPLKVAIGSKPSSFSISIEI